MLLVRYCNFYFTFTFLSYCFNIVLAVCSRTLQKLGCPVPDRKSEVLGGQKFNNYVCTCGKYTDTTTRVQELIVDKINEAELMETPVYSSPYTFTLQLSMAFVMIMGKIGSQIASALYLPPIIGFLLTGVGMQNIISPGLIKGAGGNGPHPTPFGEMRIFALIIVLMRAGISLKPKTIFKEGTLAICLCILPYACEFAVEIAVIIKLYGWSGTDAGLFASILAALSPSLVIPGMISFVEQKLGYTPRVVLISAPVEVVMAIILYNIFAQIEGSEVNPFYPWVKPLPLYANILAIPAVILFSSFIGYLAGMAAVKYFDFRRQLSEDKDLRTKNSAFSTVARVCADNSAEFLFVCIVTCYLLYAVCQPMYLQQTSGVLAVYVMMLTVSAYADPLVTHNLKEGLSGLWVFVEVILFTTTGINLTFQDTTGPLQSQRGLASSDVKNVVEILFLGTLGRSGGVLLSNLISFGSLAPHRRNVKYMLGWWMATWLFEWPKATLQATLGGLPYSQHVIPGTAGLTQGVFILHATAFAVLLFAPIGVFMTAFVGRPIAEWLKAQDDLHEEEAREKKDITDGKGEFEMVNTKHPDDEEGGMASPTSTEPLNQTREDQLASEIVGPKFQTVVYEKALPLGVDYSDSGIDKEDIAMEEILGPKFESYSRESFVQNNRVVVREHRLNSIQESELSASLVPDSTVGEIIARGRGMSLWDAPGPEGTERRRAFTLGGQRRPSAQEGIHERRGSKTKN
jgi:hypothetical protein